VCRAWETKMLARCRRKLKKIFADESLRQFRKVCETHLRLPGFDATVLLPRWLHISDTDW
jgi:hypothetical protein